MAKAWKHSSLNMFKKILIANRGEIACRIIKTAQRMNIQTVAVCSEADTDAKHVDIADEHVLIGPPPASQSYLCVDRIVAAASKTGADAIHPGYGFLSENADFVRAIERAGLVFIGPTAKAIAAMGDKIESKKLASQAGVTTVPGHLGIIENSAQAVDIANAIGYPIMIKASAGGGGKGMRIVWHERDVEENFQSARNEARVAFADERLFIEKFVEEPRHIEIQVLGDAYGNIVHLGERECSIQRRHQKVIEESPSPFLDAATRAAMGAQAVALAKAVDYRSAGTVEFIVDKKRRFYFLEMNTRLQVEHPVTEEVTGLDLVEQMIRVAAGEKLKLKQTDVQLYGSAIEARIYAENPYRNFLPSIGRLTRYVPPKEDGVRVDDGVYEGSEISIYYDPLVAKLITYGQSRTEAITRMSDALDGYYIRGIAHNINFLSAVMNNQRFREGRLSTNFISEEFGTTFKDQAPAPAVEEIFLAVAVFAHFRSESRKIYGVCRPLSSWTGLAVLNKKETAVAFEQSNTAALFIRDNCKIEISSTWQPGNPIFKGKIGKTSVTVEIDRLALGYRLTALGASHDVMVLTPRQAAALHLMTERPESDHAQQLICPMPGLVVSIAVKTGDVVEAGQTLAVVEAMKMENILKAERLGKVKTIYVKKGDSLAVDTVIMDFA